MSARLSCSACIHFFFVFVLFFIVSSSSRKKAEHDDRTTGHGVPEIDAKELGKNISK